MDATILTVSLVSFFGLIVSWLALPGAASEATPVTVSKRASVTATQGSPA